MCINSIGTLCSSAFGQPSVHVCISGIESDATKTPSRAVTIENRSPDIPCLIALCLEPLGVGEVLACGVVWRSLRFL